MYWQLIVDPKRNNRVDIGQVDMMANVNRLDIVDNFNMLDIKVFVDMVYNVAWTLRDQIKLETVDRVDMVDKVDEMNYVDTVDFVDNVDVWTC